MRFARSATTHSSALLLAATLMFVGSITTGVGATEARPEGVPATATFVEKGQVWVLDKDGTRVVYRPDGSRVAEGPFNGGHREGAWVFYHANKNVRARGTFKASRMEGEWVLYHANGKRESDGKYSDNYRVGVWTFYTDDGRKRAEGEFKDGYRWGGWTEYYSSGKTFYTGTYIKNKEQGEFKYYTEAGSLVQAGKFKGGVRVGLWYVCAGGRCGKQTFKQSEVPRFSGPLQDGSKSSAPTDLTDIMDGKRRRAANWR